MKMRYQPSAEVSPPSVLYIPPPNPEEDVRWRMIAQFAWQARWNLEGPLGWTEDMVHPSSRPAPADAPKSYGKCSISNVLVAQAIGARLGTELVIGAGDSRMPSRSWLRSVDDHVVAQQPSSLDGRPDPNAMLVDVVGDQIGLADVVVASRLALGSLFGVIYHYPFRGEFAIDDFIRRAKPVDLSRHLERLRPCLDAIEINDDYSEQFTLACRLITEVMNDIWDHTVGHQSLFVD